MANVLIAHPVENTIVIWTDANPEDESYSRRNFIPVGRQCVVMHDDFLPWLPTMRSMLADPALSTSPADQLASTLSQQLTSLPNAPVNPLGVIIAGFFADGSPVLLGLHSIQTYAVTRFPASVSAGLAPAIWTYLASVLQTIPRTFDNVVDMCLIAGLAYREVHLLSATASAIAVVSQSQSLYWMPYAEIQRRQTQNNHRLHALRLGLTNQVQEFSR